MLILTYLGCLFQHLKVPCDGRDPKIGGFDPYDINNHMFEHESLDNYRDEFNKFRFVNLFGEGVKGRSVDPNSVVPIG